MLMHTRDFLWSSLAILWVPDKTRSGGPYNETCEILARQLRPRELCQKQNIASAKEANKDGALR